MTREVTITRSISVTKAHVDFVKDKVQQGVYASESEVYRAALRALQEQEAASEKEFEVRVLKAIAELIANPENTFTVDEVKATIKQRAAARRDKP